jgi:peptidoglycan/LPS O-acetylase OafA/YrhL
MTNLNIKECGGFSVILDASRVIAAFIVFVYHSKLIPDNLYRLDHDAVMFFFVLSGYLISIAADREKSPSIFVLNRVSRILSVSIPAILLTFMVGVIINNSEYPLRENFVWMAGSIIFINSIQNILLVNPYNIAYWSLPYEVWFYFIFGIAIYMRSNWIKYFIILGILITLGLRVVVVFPVWLLGVLVYQLHRNVKIAFSKPIVSFIIVFDLMGYLVFKVNFGHEPLFDAWYFGSGFCSWLWENYGLRMDYSVTFIYDLIVGIFFAVFLACIRYCTINVNFHRLKGFCRVAAGFSFSLYLYQQPLMFLLAPLKIHGDFVWIIFVLIIIVGLAEITEHKRGTVKILLLKIGNNINNYFRLKFSND